MKVVPLYLRKGGKKNENNEKAFAMFVAVFTLLATLCMVPVSAATTVAAQLYGRIEDNGQAIYKWY